ncbi:alpha-(1-_3)-arabinofuranosyltransferase family protein [Nocardioides sp. Arc9.136]|uniref:alpha-(1->3)-arabinofuranosyltransferase domain-containing protein n=1 Tax=Nocardioides sp. Arc9.136 TaxID=2996826 RepID=UPI0026657AB4|nr:alpha-(1->3)-arabinofuranosyltransferase family protein [Nocardioides sp. Arc9.136]WKN50149.1 alpha-(1->3)-arabinofuranosyltransferase family protein [Nocardioides sp. Arc9.136]
MTATEPLASTPGTFRFRLLASCVLLVGLAFVQDPGLLAADTKLDLALAPADWLSRALHLWDAEGAFGQLQNQAYGYLWPMGPFFLLGWLVDLPGWVVQRLWQGLVMSVALVGTAKVARALGVRSDLACLVAGFAFALSPRLLTTLGPISIEAWPSAVAPWVLLPLVRGATHGSPRRAAALSALAVAMVGGVNAAATFAVLPLGIVWLLTRTPGPRRRSLMLWWPLFTALGTLWWLVPLFVMGAYSPPFLDFIETTSVTTFPTTLFDALRGTSNWVPYADAGSRAGNDLVRTSWVLVLSGVLLLLGAAGLLDRRTPHRAFLGLSLVVGALMVTAGHRGAVEGWFAEPVADLLDGVLAPLRNVHKFDPVLRLPLVLGLAFVVDRTLAALREHRDAPRADRVNRRVLVLAAVVAVVGTAAPALQGRVEPAGATLGVPDYWHEVADYVADESAGGTALLVPGSPFGEYLWGDTADEPMQWLADSRWAVRNVIPLTPPATIRMLDGIEQRLAEGDGSAGLTAALRRAGVEHLVVRNDLQRSDDVPDPVLVHQAIDASPGIERVAEFGPAIGGDAHLRDDGQRILVNGGWQAERPAVEVYAVSPAASPAVSGGDPTVLAAGPEDLPDLLDLDVLGGGPTVLAPDAEDLSTGDGRPGRVVLTDGLRERERSFARIHDGTSAVTTPGDVPRSDRPVRDYPLDDMDRWTTTARLEGARAVSASSSLSDADTSGGSDRGALPYAALDGAPDTAWDSGFRDGTPWWRVDLEEPLDVEQLTVTAAAGHGRQRLRVVTEHGASEPVELSAGGTRRVLLPAGQDGSTEVGWVRVEGAGGPSQGQLAIAEVDVPGLTVRRVLDLPSVPAGWGAPDAVVLRAGLDGRTGCVQVALRDRCAAGRDRTSEDGPVVRRSFELPAARAYDASLTARPRAGAALDRLVLRDQPASAAASSTALADPRAGAVATIDGDPASTWLAAPDDEQVELTLSWLGRRPVRGIDLDVDADVAARLPDSVLLSFTRQGRVVALRELELGRAGRARFPAVRADGVTIQVLSAERASDLSFDGSGSDVPVGIGEVGLEGVPYLPLGLSDTEVRQPCGTGPELRIGTRRTRTALRASPLQLLRGVEVPAVPCGPVRGPLLLSAGAVDVAAARGDASQAASVVLTAVDDPGPAPAPTSAVEDLSGPVERVLEPAPGDTLVALRENANAGWTATQDGAALDPVVVDGWQQGFRLAGDGPVSVRFAPDTTYRAGLLGGALALLGLVAVVGLTRRRWAGPVPEPLADRRVARPVAVVLGLLGAGLVAGTGGLVVGALTVAAVLVLDRRAPEVSPWALATPLLVAAAAYALTPWGSSSGWAGEDAWVGYLSVVTLVAAVSTVGSGRVRGTRRFRRIAGTSSSR